MALDELRLEAGRASPGVVDDHLPGKVSAEHHRHLSRLAELGLAGVAAAEVALHAPALVRIEAVVDEEGERFGDVLAGHGVLPRCSGPRR